ncbi:MAG: quinolinate synthase NadA [Syntrophales bacterium]|nr:quinolinate synthase NadA [Syntrophales bacterium]MDY0045082.1 quinolinate synthase NadA [Syntrophales bacterium]
MGRDEIDGSKKEAIMTPSEMQKEIRALLKEKNAILLAHYYQSGEIQDTADILGDSLALSMEAAKTDADIIVFAGVRFMAESAYILSPEKAVLLPVPDAGCPLADKITAAELMEEKKTYPGAAVVTYVNSSAQTKAESDICCTSSNAVKIVNSLDADQVLMVPDGNLARYTARFTSKTIIPWKGFCYVHDQLSADDIGKVKSEHPDAPVAVHPECRTTVIDMADFVGSTAAIIDFARKTTAREVIIGTELGIMHQLKKLNPEKTFIPASKNLICRDMRKIGLRDILVSLKEMKHIVTVPEDVRAPAYKALERMLAVS